jgi:GT2 family glycosyltransferase
MISIAILTFNRQEVLLENLEVISKQTYLNKEVIVVDNGNSKQTKNLVAQHYPQSTYIGMPSNVGCDARNFGLRAARGEIVVTLDDDVLLSEVDSLSKIIRCFERRRDASVMNFKIVFEEDRSIIPFNWFHPRDYRRYGNEEFETDYISEGAAAFRKEVFDHAGYYPAEFYLSHEGPDLAYRIINAGYTIIYSPEIEVIHKVDRNHRPSWRNSYYDTRNQIWLGVRNLPLAMLMQHMAYRLITTLLFSLFRGHIIWYLRAIWDAFIGIPREMKYRRPISRETVTRLREIRRCKPNLLNKIRQFFEKVRLIKGYYN